jgi:ABC-type branched-subunit amino acid transport system permease subunit
MTLFFAQVFVELANNLDRITLPWADRPLDLTGGPNGIAGLDPVTLFGFRFSHISHYFYLLLALLVLLVIALHNLDHSRTGRAWKSLREDTLAARLMTVPANRLKLMAYMFGAATAGLAGSVFAAVQVGAFPQNFEVTLLITVYAALILGGAGSIPGAIAGAIVIGAVPEILRSPDAARWLFYGAVVVGLIAVVRPWLRLAALLAGVVVLGAVVRVVVTAVWDDVVATGGGDALLSRLLDGWLVVLQRNQDVMGNYAFLLLMIAILGSTQLAGWPRIAALIPTVYLGAFVWENRLVLNPSITRQMLFGAVLVVMMTARPQGLLGKPRVEIP